MSIFDYGNYNKLNKLEKDVANINENLARIREILERKESDGNYRIKEQ